jgi:hypothetical protein
MARKGLRHCQESPGFLMARDKNRAQKCEKDNDPWAHEVAGGGGTTLIEPRLRARDMDTSLSHIPSCSAMSVLDNISIYIY